MKAIKIPLGDSHVWARPLNFGQLEEFEDLIKEIGKESAATMKSTKVELPLKLLRKQLQIVTAAVKNYNPDFDRSSEFTMQGIAVAFVQVIQGSGLEEVPAGEAKPGR